jgi:hypothetical protein
MQAHGTQQAVARLAQSPHIRRPVSHAYAKPPTKAAVMSKSNPGKIFNIVSRDRIGLPVLRNESRSPPMPIKVPPTPTRAKPGATLPRHTRMNGIKVITRPATP